MADAFMDIDTSNGPIVEDVPDVPEEEWFDGAAASTKSGHGNAAKIYNAFATSREHPTLDLIDPTKRAHFQSIKMIFHSFAGFLLCARKKDGARYKPGTLTQYFSVVKAILEEKVKKADTTLPTVDTGLFDDDVSSFGIARPHRIQKWC